jgi:hypothetical protein
MTGLNNSDGQWFEEKGLHIRMPGAIADRNSIGAMTSSVSLAHCIEFLSTFFH